MMKLSARMRKVLKCKKKHDQFNYNLTRYFRVFIKIIDKGEKYQFQLGSVSNELAQNAII